MLKKMFGIGIFLICAAASATSQIIPVVWPFSVGSSDANMIRTLIDNANQQQNRYQFVFTSRPGAGGYVAANSVSASRELQVLFSSSSFYIRPVLFNESHDVNHFNLVGEICSNKPLAIFSRKHQDLNEMIKKESSIGVNPGSITQLVVKSIQRHNPNIQIVEVPYKGTPEASMDMIGGRIDGSVDFLGQSTISRMPVGVSVVGITGNQNHQGFRSFESQNVRGLSQLTTSYYLLVKDSVSVTQQQELNQIFYQAINSRFAQFCTEDFGKVDPVPFDQLAARHRANRIKWEEFARGIPKQ